MPAVELLVADRRHDARRLSGFQDDDDLIRLGSLEVRVDEFVAPALWRLDNRGVPLVGLILHPALKLLCGAAQDIAADGTNLCAEIHARQSSPAGIARPEHQG